MENTPGIKIVGARQNNLKNLNLEIPLNRITVVTGVSGAGKSSLAFDTLYAEGQRRYVETFSPYARQFMERMDRPHVDRIENIPPAIAIDRKDPVRTSRSTVGTMTELTDHLKLLYARMGKLHCRGCGRPVLAETPEHVWDAIRDLPGGSEVVLTFSVPLNKTPTEEIRREWHRMGFTRFFRNRQIEELEGWHPENHEDEVQIVADRLPFKTSERKRIIDSLEQAFRLGGGRLHLWIKPSRHLSFSNTLECARCHISYSEPTPNLFSFNTPLGACGTCRGFGRVIDIDLDLVIPDPSLSIGQGAIKPWGSLENGRMELDDLMDFCRRRKIPTHVPFQRLSKPQKRDIIEGTSGYYGIRGFFNWLETKTYKMPVRVFLSRYRSYRVCPDCHGTRFKEEALLYLLQGKNIAEINAMAVEEVGDFFNGVSVPAGDKASRLILDEICSRLRYLREVGLGYLTLDRQSRTLSGGEVQRVALTSALGSSLVNALYVLDEPSIGLHPRDNHRLIGILRGLRDLQNTVVVVEHDPEIISQSDFMLDLGPRAGEQGGQVMYFGPVSLGKDSLTGQYLSGKKSIPVPGKRRKPQRGQWLTITGASENNLRNVDIAVPLGLFTCLTGVSGSGKSTFAEEVLYKAGKRAKGASQGRPGAYRSIRGIEKINDLLMVDQRPIGRTPRANILTYTKALDPIRKLLADTEGARKRRLKPGHFSFNVPGGRCETCKGAGFEKVEMQFLSDVFVTCPQCKGQRFTKKVLEVTFQGKTIYDILAMTVDRALGFFKDHPGVGHALEPLVEVGLGYMRLGQPLNTLSGGEAQRLKLSRHLRAGQGGARLFIFDEPTTGLHFEDIQRFLTAIQRLADRGHSLLVIEHNMDVVKTADWVIDLGPEGGENGGRVVAAGAPEDVAVHPTSHTGKFLRQYLSTPGRLQNATPLSQPAPHGQRGNHRPAIAVWGAREHNLKNLSLTIPRQQLVVVTGVSGSGKSTLIFDIVFAEGQRRYLESLAPYVRQYVKILERPDVDAVSGIPPTVAIQQRISHASRRSTVATLTEAYHFLRLLYSKLGAQHCPGCGRILITQGPDEILAQVQQTFRRRKARVLAPKVFGRKGFHKDVLDRAFKMGIREVRIDGRFMPLTRGMALSRYHEHTIELVMGTLPSGDLHTLVALALREGNGNLVIVDKGGSEEIFSRRGICPACGIGLKELDPRLFSFNSKQGACPRCDGLGMIEDRRRKKDLPCPLCLGSRLNPQALSVMIQGYGIWDIVQQPATRAGEILKGFRFARHETPIAKPILSEILTRLDLMERLGLSHLALSRSGDTLSGGEAQRIRLAAQLGSNLTGVCYILDEPTIGLHARDNRLLLNALRELKGRGNSILVVEHDEETIRRADHIIDLGPGAGEGGGNVVATGTLAQLKKNPASLTGASFNGRPHAVTSRLRPHKKGAKVKIRRATEHNLKGIDVCFPLGSLICITGVSGSGKSTLVKETLFRGLRNKLLNLADPAGTCRAITGWEQLDRVLEVDHSPIGRTPRSVPSSYVGFLSDIRKLLSMTPKARSRGYRPGRFSFNVRGGRCEACKGHGSLKVEMSFLPDVYVHCEVCNGRRFNQETLDITYRGRNISEILNLTFEEAEEFFSAVPPIRRGIRAVGSIGLGYLRLGQPSPTLSGGEAQRIKLAEEVAKPSRGRTLYVLDEPTTGLHIHDVQRLTEVLQALVDQGNTVAVIEHNMEIVKEADYIIDLGPEGGDGGGRIVFAGSPLEILASPNGSHTAQFLKKYLTA